MKAYILVFVSVLLVACGGESSVSDQSSSKKSALQLNEVWPYEVSGTIDIIDAGVADSNYASWAIGTITIKGTEEVPIDFETAVLEDGGIDLDFNFRDPAKVLLGKPKKKYGENVYPVLEIL